MSNKSMQCASTGCKPATTENTTTVSITPPVDILETEHELVVHADMPGVVTEDVDIRYENGELSVHGKRNRPNKERNSAHYFRSFRLTERIAADKIEASLKNGVLTLRLPKVDAAKPRKITVKG